MPVQPRAVANVIQMRDDNRHTHAKLNAGDFAAPRWPATRQLVNLHDLLPVAIKLASHAKCE
jgi:hypothetical protein